VTPSEYSLMKDSAFGRDTFNGWTYLAGVRLYF